MSGIVRHAASDFLYFSDLIDIGPGRRRRAVLPRRRIGRDGRSRVLAALPKAASLHPALTLGDYRVAGARRPSLRLPYSDAQSLASPGPASSPFIMPGHWQY